MSQNAGYFLNSMMGWPMLPSANLPAGGPAYPLSGLGVRARAHPSDALTIMAGVFNGSPIPLNSPNTPLSNPNGVSFPLNTGVLAIAELQYAFPAAPPSGKPAADGPLPGTYKIGAWYDSENFDDQQVDTVGVPLASPASNGMPAEKQGNYAIYAVADQMIWRSSDPNRNVSAFLRPMFTTLQDRNLISVSVNGGLTLHDPLPGRDNDVFGVGFGVARVERRRSRLRPAAAILQSERVYTRARRGNVPGSDLSGPGPALVADPARRPVCRQPRRRPRQPLRADPGDQERVGDRPAHQHHVLTGSARRGTAAGARAAAGARRTSATAKSAAPPAST